MTGNLMFGHHAKATIANHIPVQVENEPELLLALRGKLGPAADEGRLLYHIRAARGKVHWAVNSFLREAMSQPVPPPTQHTRLRPQQTSPWPPSHTQAFTSHGTSSTGGSAGVVTSATEATASTSTSSAIALGNVPTPVPSGGQPCSSGTAGAAVAAGCATVVDACMAPCGDDETCCAPAASPAVTVADAAISSIPAPPTVSDISGGASSIPAPPTVSDFIHGGAVVAGGGGAGGGAVEAATGGPGGGGGRRVSGGSAGGSAVVSLDSLPTGVLEAVVCWLEDPASVVALGMTCSTLRRAASCDAAWRSLFLTRWGHVVFPVNPGGATPAATAAAALRRRLNPPPVPHLALSLNPPYTHPHPHIPHTLQPPSPPLTATSHGTNGVQYNGSTSSAVSVLHLPAPPSIQVPGPPSGVPITAAGSPLTEAASQPADGQTPHLLSLLGPTPSTCSHTSGHPSNHMSGHTSARPDSPCASTSTMPPPAPLQPTSSTATTTSTSSTATRLSLPSPRTLPPPPLGLAAGTSVGPGASLCLLPPGQGANGSRAAGSSGQAQGSNIATGADNGGGVWQDRYRVQASYESTRSCPCCGARGGKVVPLVYGFPSPPLLDGMRCSRLILGGDHLIADGHCWVCIACNASFRSYPYEAPHLWRADHELLRERAAALKALTSGGQGGGGGGGQGGQGGGAGLGQQHQGGGAAGGGWGGAEGGGEGEQGQGEYVLPTYTYEL